MIIISVNQPSSCLQSGKLPHCYFKRELQSHKDTCVSIESIVNVLHILFSGVEHVIDIKYIF